MKVLVPMDGSEQSWNALEHALERFPDAAFVCLRVINPVETGHSFEIGAAATADTWMETQRDAAESTFEEVRERAAEAGIEVETETEVGRPSRAIVEYAEEHDVDHVVVGSHGREGLTRVLLGSVAETVVRRSPVPVTVVR